MKKKLMILFMLGSLLTRWVNNSEQVPTQSTIAVTNRYAAWDDPIGMIAM